MKVEPRPSRLLYNLIVGLLFMFGLVAFSSLYSGGAIAYAEAVDHGTVPAGSECEPEDGGEVRCKLVGRVDEMPDDMLGDWKIDGESFTVTVNTEIREEHGLLAINACVSVHYDPSGSAPYEALLFKTESDDDCQGDGGGDHDGHEAKAHGLIEDLPDDPDLRGVWTVNGIEYEVKQQTSLKDAVDQYKLDACVEITYDSATDPFVAHRIQLDDDCDGDGGGDDGGDHGDHDNEFRGVIEVLPCGEPPCEDLTGIWTVSGTEFDVTDSTELEAEYGAFDLGICVEINYDDSTTPYTAIEIEGKRDYACNGDGDGGDDGADDHDGEGVLFGELQTFPAGLIGEWQVGGWLFLADDKTEFEQERGEFEVGAMVKIEFYVTSDGVNYATEIELKYEHDDEDGDHHGSHHGAEGNAFGAIDSFPAELIGDWVIGGLTYTADESTHFEQEHGLFADEGAWVKVRYHQDADGNRIADKIETKNDHAGGGHEQFKLVGFVDEMPVTGFMGEWIVGGEIFVADNRTQFDEEHSVLAKDAYVELKYTPVNGVNTLHEIHTEVPPDAGDTDDVGEIEEMDGPAAAGVNEITTWRIDGQNYIITDATLLNDGASDLVVGSTAVVNSYVANDGSQVATSVTGIEINHHIFLPLATMQ